MTHLELKNKNEILQCFNCATKINDVNLKRCPNCGIILDPNHYVKWRNSFFGCVCLLCLIPIFIAIIVSIYAG